MDLEFKASLDYRASSRSARLQKRAKSIIQKLGKQWKNPKALSAAYSLYMRLKAKHEGIQELSNQTTNSRPNLQQQPEIHSLRTCPMSSEPQRLYWFKKSPGRQLPCMQSPPVPTDTTKVTAGNHTVLANSSHLKRNET